MTEKSCNTCNWHSRKGWAMKCGLNRDAGKTVLAEIALRSGNVCGPDRKGWTPRATAAPETTGQTPMPYPISI